MVSSFQGLLEISAVVCLFNFRNVVGKDLQVLPQDSQKSLSRLLFRLGKGLGFTMVFFSVSFGLSACLRVY